jgi:LssY C-terminus
LIAKLSESAGPLLVGSSRELRSDTAGHLFLALNQTAKSECAFAVKVTITHAQAAGQATAQSHNMKDQLSSAAKVWLTGELGTSTSANNTPTSNAISENGNATVPASSSAPARLKIPTAIVDSDLGQHLDGLPRRVHDHLGNLGDMVNFVIVGSQERVQAALDASDWYLADLDSKESGLKAIVDTYEKKDYLQMPMSHLYLFDRMQDFGYEQAQAFAVVATRHHFRLWKAPFTWNGEVVWVGAGTHDIGFEKDIRTGKLTHKIDPAVDGERENIAQSFDKSGKAKSMTYYLPPNPVQDAKNASGGSYHSDGRLLVIFLK